MILEIWEQKLAPLVERDHFIREGLLKRGILSDAYHPEMEKVHLENARKLKALIDQHGFPVLSNAGEKGVRLSWLIIHHAISWPSFMQECVIEMRLAGAARDYPLELLAYVEDRIAYFEGRGQLYGTNFDWLEGELKPTPIEDPDKLDFRRKAFGLPPMNPAARITEERPPADPVKKNQEFNLWLKKVGWRP